MNNSRINSDTGDLKILWESVKKIWEEIIQNKII